jgi:hypothetical protein
VYPSGIKQHPGRRPEEPVSFQVDHDAPYNVQFPVRLEQHLRLRREADRVFPGYNLGVLRYLASPQPKSKVGFEDRPFNSSE